MTEKLISLKGVDPKSLFGAYNKYLNKISSVFPKVKIIARGSDLKIMGDERELSLFEERLEMILDFLHEYNEMTEDDLNLLLDDAGKDNGEKNGKKNEVLVYGNSGKPIQARTINQLNLVLEYEENDLLLAVGPAGTGKTYTAIALAVRALKNKEVRKIVLTRPAVEAGEHLGFLPGDMREKLDPYLQPLYDALRDMIAPKKLTNYIEDCSIQIAPLAFMRGRTLENAFVIMDEAQNATLNQLKMFLTRMGSNSKFIVTGDISQVDLPRNTHSGLLRAIELFENTNGIQFVFFDKNDVMRHPIVRKIIEVYEQKDT